MRTIYIVSEDNHGDLAITLSYEAAINFLIGEGWLDKSDEAFFKRMYPEEFNEHMENTDETLRITKVKESEYSIFKLR